MQRALIGAPCAMLLLCAQPALAADFHPLESLILAGGIYEYDNIFIPAGVTLSFVGEDRKATLRALDSLTLAGSLVAPGWQITIEAQRIEATGQIDVGGVAGSSGSIWLRVSGGESDPTRTPPGAGAGAIIALPGGDIGLGGGLHPLSFAPPPPDSGVGGLILIGDIGNLIVTGGSDCSNTIQSPVPEPETWAMLLAGLGLVGLMAQRRDK